MKFAPKDSVLFDLAFKLLCFSIYNALAELVNKLTS